MRRVPRPVKRVRRPKRRQFDEDDFDTLEDWMVCGQPAVANR